jgi:hypothetical protein
MSAYVEEALRPARRPPRQLGRPAPEGAASRSDPAVWRGIADLIHAKGGQMRAHYAMLCVLYWLRAERDCTAVSPADVKAIMPHLGDTVAGRLRSPADTLRRARNEGLVAALGEGQYELTPLGLAVVQALPDAAQVGALRGVRRPRCRRREPSEVDEGLAGAARAANAPLEP